MAAPSPAAPRQRHGSTERSPIGPMAAAAAQAVPEAGLPVGTPVKAVATHRNSCSSDADFEGPENDDYENARGFAKLLSTAC